MKVSAAGRRGLESAGRPSFSVGGDAHIAPRAILRTLVG